MLPRLGLTLGTTCAGTTGVGTSDTPATAAFATSPPASYRAVVEDVEGNSVGRDGPPP